MLLNGVAFTYGLLLPALVDQFPDCGRAIIGGVASLMIGISWCAGARRHSLLRPLPLLVSGVVHACPLRYLRKYSPVFSKFSTPVTCGRGFRDLQVNVRHSLPMTSAPLTLPVHNRDICLRPVPNPNQGQMSTAIVVSGEEQVGRCPAGKCLVTRASASGAEY